MISLPALLFPVALQAAAPPGASPTSRTTVVPATTPSAASSTPPSSTSAATMNGGTTVTAAPGDPAAEAPVQSPIPTGRVLRLDDAERIAEHRQPTIIEAQANTEAARGRRDEARSGLLPQVIGSASYQIIHGTLSSASKNSTLGSTTTSAPNGTGGVSSTTAVGTSGTSPYLTFGGTASQLLWDFGQTYNRTKAADKSVESFEASESTAELQILLNVRKAYFGARAQKDLITVAQETVNNQLRHLEQTQGFVTVGTQPEIALAQARTDLANYRVQLINAQNNYEIAKAQLNQAMGVVQDTAYDVGSEELPPIDGEDLPAEPLVKKALAARPELVAYQKTREADRLTVRALKGAYGPSISAIGGLNETGTEPDNLGTNWNAGASLSWPIFQGGLTNGQVREAQGNLDAADAQLEQEKLQVRFDVEQALLTVKANKASIIAAKDAETNAKEQLRLAEGRYQSGVGSIIELGDAQVAASNAGAQLVTAQFNLASARAQLLTAIGKR